MKILKIKKANLSETAWVIEPKTELEFYIIPPKKIILKNWEYFSTRLLQYLTKAYDAGTVVEVEGSITVQGSGKTLWQYYATNLTLPTVPRRFKNTPEYFSIFEKALRTKSIEDMQTLEETVKAYNEETKQLVYKHNNYSWATAEEFYKKMYALTEHGYKVYSPNEKTFWEYTAEQRLAQTLEELQDDKLTERQLAELEYEGPLYGVLPQQVYLSYYNRKTKHGWTTEPYTVLEPKQYEFHKLRKNKYMEGQAPFSVRKDNIMKELPNNKAMKEAYETLQYLKQFGDEFLLDGYHRCPVCNMIYNEREGCNEHVAPIEMFPAPKLFYGLSGEYEDYEIMKKLNN